VVHCEVNQRHMRRSHPTKEAALKDACSQLLQGHAVNRIVGPNRTITAERVRDWCATHWRPSCLGLRLPACLDVATWSGVTKINLEHRSKEPCRDRSWLGSIRKSY